MGEKTGKDLMSAFAGESQANRKYLIFAKKAEEEGKKNAAKLFRAAAEAETIHAFKEFELAGGIGTTAENLAAAKSGETYEFTQMYPEFEKDALEEGEKKAHSAFAYAKAAEEVHAKLYDEALKSLGSEQEVSYYVCPVCGNIETARPGKCSICGVSGDKFLEF
jgi:rubrerythrin